MTLLDQVTDALRAVGSSVPPLEFIRELRERGLTITHIDPIDPGSVQDAHPA